MPDSDHSLELLLKTKADLAGAKSVQAALELTIAKMKALGRETSAQEAQLTKVKSAIEAYNKAHGEGGEKMKLFGEETTEAKHAARELAEQFPLVSAALKILINPVGGVLSLAIIAFSTVKEKLDEWNKSLDETAERLADPTFAEAIKARREALEAGEIAAASYVDKMAHLIDPEEAYAKALTSQIEIMNARNAAMGQVDDATHGFDQAKAKHGQDLQEAALTDMLARGIITYQQYTQQKLQLDVDYIAKLNQLEVQHEKQKVERENADRWKVINEEDKLLDHQKKRQPELEKSATEAHEKAVSANAKVARDKADLAIAESPDVGKEVADKEAYIKKKYGYRAGDTDGGISALREDAEAGVGKAKDDLDDYETALARRKTLLDQRDKLRKRIPGEAVDAQLSVDAASRAEAAAEANKNRVTEGDLSLQQHKDDANVAYYQATGVQQQNRNTAAVNSQTDMDKLQLPGGRTGTDLQNFENLFRQQQQHVIDPTHVKALTDAETKSMESMKNYLASRGVWTKQFQDLVLGGMKDAATELENFRKEIKAINGKIKGSYNQ